MGELIQKKKAPWIVHRRSNAQKRQSLVDFFNNHGAGLVEKSIPGNGLYIGYWSDEFRRMRWTRALAAYLGKDPRDLCKSDFLENGLAGLLSRCGSVYAAVSEAFPKLEIKEWEMHITPPGFYNGQANRSRATRWLVDRLKKDPRSLLVDDFRNNGLAGLIHFHGHSAWRAVAEAYPELVKSKKDMLVRSHGTYSSRQARLAILRSAIYKSPDEYSNEEREVAEKHRHHIDEMIFSDWGIWVKLSKPVVDPRDLTAEFFRQKGIYGLFQHYDESVYKLICDLLPEQGIKPWELLKTPAGTFDTAERRREAVRWLCEVKLKRDPREITSADFLGNRLSGLLKHYSFNYFLALKDAYPEIDFEPWAMPQTPRGTFATPESRGDAIIWLSQKLGKQIESLTRKDLIRNGLAQILRLKTYVADALAEGVARKAQLEADGAGKLNSF